MRARRVLITLGIAATAATGALVAAPTPATAATVTGGSLSRVSCASTQFCLAVGLENPPNTYVPPLPIVQVRRDGVWSPVDFTGYLTRGYRPSDVSCTSDRFCMVVLAGRTTDAPLSTLIWNGTTWRYVPAPKPAGSLTGLTAVSCTSAISCVAVGSSVTPAANRPYALRWDGYTWSRIVVPAYPAAGSAGVQVVDVSCAATTCTAVGYRESSDRLSEAGIVGRVVGGTWTWLTDAETTMGKDVFLEGVDCPTATSCVGVGRAGGVEFLLRSNGGSWTRQDVSTPSVVVSPAVSCPTDTSSCLVVGRQYPFSDDRHDAFAHLVAGSTATSITPRAPATSTGFTDVSCVTITVCVAVGSRGGDSSNERSITLAESWNGNRWIREAV